MTAVRVKRPSPRALVAAIVVGALTLAPAAAGAPGALDATFSDYGWVRTLEVRSGGTNYLPKGAQDIAIQPDGSIVAVGELQDGNSRWEFGVFRYTPAGALDPSFGQGGWSATDIGTFEVAHAVALQRDGRIVVGGAGDCPLAMCFALVRYNPDGSVDLTFGTGGLVLTMFPKCGCRIFDLLVQADGRIVATGYRFRYGDAQNDNLFAVARYLPDGRLDPSFSGDGRVTVDFGYGDDLAYAIAQQRDGKILVAGAGTRNLYRTGDDFAIARLRPNGRLDRTFSGDGRATINFRGRSFESAASVAVQRNGRILLAGASSRGFDAPPRIAVARLLASGRLDGSFGTYGKRRLSPSAYGGSAAAIVQHPDGRLLVAGRAFVDPQRLSSDWVVLRYRGGGALDRSFGGDGIVATDFGTGADGAEAVAVQADGKIVVGGSIYGSQGLARYLSH